MTGRLSRVWLTRQAVDAVQVAVLINSRDAVPDTAIQGYTVAMATGRTAAVDHNSELSSDVCLDSTSCRRLDDSKLQLR